MNARERMAVVVLAHLTIVLFVAVMLGAFVASAWWIYQGPPEQQPFGEGPWRCTVVDRDDVGRGQVFDCKGRGG